MSWEPPLLLLGAVGAVGVLHTVVPDHWAPIVAIARQRGWSRAETARAATLAGVGHVGSTLIIAIVVWAAGVAVAQRFGRLADVLSSLALIGFGGWILVGAWVELRRSPTHAHAHSAAHPHHHAEAPGYGFDPLYLPLPAGTAVLARHRHWHRHGNGLPHLHWHDHAAATAHPVDGGDPPLHAHRHRTSARVALPLILGSSPMVEGIPAFFAASHYGSVLIALMAVLFASATIATYVLLCVGSLAGVARLRLGAFERYGEVLSGGVIAAVGIAFGLLWAL